MNLTLQYIEIEQLSATVMALSWCVGATIGGALDSGWFARARAAEGEAPYFGVMRTLIRSWIIAIPLFEVGKALAVAAVILPVGGWLALDGQTAVADVGGMFLTIALWRTVLLRVIAAP